MNGFCYVMKKIVFITVFILLTTTIFAEEQLLIDNEQIRSSNGNLYSVDLIYEGKNNGQKSANDTYKSIQMTREMTGATWYGEQLRSLSDEQFEIIKKILNRYNISTGDTFSFLLKKVNNNVNNFVIMVICEITSSTQNSYKYIWWAYRL